MKRFKPTKCIWFMYSHKFLSGFLPERVHRLCTMYILLLRNRYERLIKKMYLPSLMSIINKPSILLEKLREKD